MRVAILEPFQLGELRSQGSPDGNCVRRFVITAVNFRAIDYTDLIDWQACNVTLPIVLRQISSHELLKIIQDDVPKDGWDLIKFPSHTQEVERIVKLVTEASGKRVAPQSRDGFIRVTVESMKLITQFESKNDYKPAGVVSPKLSRILLEKGVVSPPPPAWIKKFEPIVTQDPTTIRKYL
ncbi:hypothetical protein AVEN_201398-1, partial [Araneus ventricosus]